MPIYITKRQYCISKLSSTFTFGFPVFNPYNTSCICIQNYISYNHFEPRANYMFVCLFTLFGFSFMSYMTIEIDKQIN